MESKKKKDQVSKKKLLSDREQLYKDATEVISSMQYYNTHYERILNYVADPKKFNDLKGDDDMTLVEVSLKGHKEATAQMMRTLMVNRNIINAAFENDEEAQDKPIMINPFVRIRYDKDAGTSYLEYPKEGKFKQILYQLIDMEDKSQAELASDTAVSVIPIVGTAKDLYHAGVSFYREDYDQFWTDYGWGILGAVSDIAMFGMGKTVLKGGVKGTVAVARGGKIGKFSVSMAKAISMIEKHGGKIFFGLMALQLGTYGLERIGWIANQTFDGRFYATSPDKAQDIPYENTKLSHGLQKQPKNVEELESTQLRKFYENVINELKGKLFWKNIDYEIVDDDTVIIKRHTSDESLTIKRHSEQKPYVQGNGSKGVWEIEGLDKAYDTFQQAVAIANLVNDTAEVIRENDYEGGSDEPFEVDGENVDFDRAWDESITSLGADLTILDGESNLPWLNVYNYELGIPTQWIVNALNNWYKYIYK